MKCFNCDNSATYRHHVVPRSLGGVSTVPLCGDCHAKAHSDTSGGWKTSELTKLALQNKRRKKEKTGGTIPFGFELSASGKLVANTKEREISNYILLLRREGRSLREIGEILGEMGVKTKTGRTSWAPQVVNDIINRLTTPSE